MIYINGTKNNEECYAKLKKKKKKISGMQYKQA